MISDLITQLYVIRKVNMKYIKCKMKWSGAGRGRKNINTLCVCELLIINCLWCLCWAVQAECRPRLTTRKVVRTAVAAWSVVTAVCWRRTRDHWLPSSPCTTQSAGSTGWSLLSSLSRHSSSPHTRLGVVNFVKVGGTPSVVAVICIGVAIFLYIKYVVKVIKKTFRISSLTDWTRGKTTKRRGRLLRTL